MTTTSYAATLQSHSQLTPWDSHAQKWSLVTSPLRPNDEDVALFAEQTAKDGNTLLLGVTPELQNLSAHTCAVDSNASMAAAFPASRFVCQTWQSLDPAMVPLAPFETILGDGSLNVIFWPDDLNAVLRNVAAMLVPGGKFVCRFFMSPDVAETPEEVIELALAGRIANFSAFKWHLAMSLVAQSPSPNIRVAHIHNTFERLVNDRASFAAQTGWPAAAIDVIDHYRDSATVYAFPTMAEILAAMAPCFSVETVKHGSYYLAERCPVITFIRNEI